MTNRLNGLGNMFRLDKESSVADDVGDREVLIP